MNRELRDYLASIGRIGGKRSRRVLTRRQALQMVQVREARRAFQTYWQKCFWSFDKNYKVTARDVKWVGEQLMKNGDRAAWTIGVKLCQ